MLCRKGEKEVDEAVSVWPNCVTEIKNESSNSEDGITDKKKEKKKSPYCGEELMKENLQDKDLQEDAKDLRADISEEDTRKEDDAKDQYRIMRIAFKVLTIIALVCFFCPLYIVSCAGQEILSVSGLDLMAGFEYMGEKMDGSIGYGLLGLFPLIGVCSAFRFRKNLVLLKKYEKIKELFYEISVAGGTTILVNRFFTSALEQSFQGTGADIEAAMALNVMTIASLILLIAAGYQAFRLESGAKKGVAAAKCLGKILAGVIGCFIVVAVILYVAGGLQADTAAQEYLSEASDVSEEQADTNLSELDMEDYFGESEKQLEELGLEKDEEMDEYTALDGSVYISCTDGIIDVIMLEGMDENMPAFHGVKTGMSLPEAGEMLEDAYFLAGQLDDQISYLNTDTGVNIMLEASGEEITRIAVTQMSQEEIDSYLQEASIIPDSDNNYLSEDEQAGNAQASQPFIGMEGTYICTSVSDGGFTGKIVVSGITDSTAEITLGALDLSYDVVTVQGQIIDSNTIQADIYGYSVTLVWSDAENMTASGQGELTGMDSGVIMEITNNQTYTRPLEFNQW